MIPVNDNAFKYAFIRAWNTVLGGSLANLFTELAKGSVTINSRYSGFLRVSYSLIDGDIVDEVTGNRVSSLVDS